MTASLERILHEAHVDDVELNRSGGSALIGLGLSRAEVLLVPWSLRASSDRTEIDSRNT